MTKNICTLLIPFMLMLISGCKDKHTGSYKYNNPFESPCIEAANSLNNDDSETLKKQLERGVNPDLRFLDGSSLLDCAAGSGAIKCVKILIEYKADVNIQSSDGTALHTVARPVLHNQREIAQILIDAGIDVSLKDANGSTALDNARANNYPKIADIIENRMKQLGLKIEDTFIEISKDPNVSIQKVRGNASKSYITFHEKGSFIAVNKTLSEMIAYLSDSPWICDVDKLPNGIYRVEVKSRLLAQEEIWPILKQAFEKTFNLKFVTQNRPIDLYTLKINPDKALSIRRSQNDGEFHEDYTEKGFHLTHCDMNDLCRFLDQELGIEVINETSLEGIFDLSLDFEPSVLKQNLYDDGLLLVKTKKERETLVIKKSE